MGLPLGKLMNIDYVTNLAAGSGRNPLDEWKQEMKSQTKHMVYIHNMDKHTWENISVRDYYPTDPAEIRKRAEEELKILSSHRPNFNITEYLTRGERPQISGRFAGFTVLSAIIFVAFLFLCGMLMHHRERRRARNGGSTRKINMWGDLETTDVSDDEEKNTEVLETIKIPSYEEENLQMEFGGIKTSPAETANPNYLTKLREMIKRAIFRLTQSISSTTKPANGGQDKTLKQDTGTTEADDDDDDDYAYEEIFRCLNIEIPRNNNKQAKGNKVDVRMSESTSTTKSQGNGKKERNGFDEGNQKSCNIFNKVFGAFNEGYAPKM